MDSPSRLLNGVKVAVNNLVEILGDNFGNLLQLGKVKGSILDQHGKTDTCQVANSRLIRSSVLDNLTAQVGALDRSQVLLIGLAVAVILVEHVGRARLHLRVENSEPQVLRLDCFPRLSFRFILVVERFKLVSPNITQSWALVGAHETPVSIALDTLHEQVWHPHGIEQISGAIRLVSVVLAQIQKVINIRVPRFQVHGNGSLALAASLIHIASRIVKDSQHGHDSVGRSVGSTNITLAGTDVVNGESDSSGVLGDDGAVFERIVNALNRVVLHGE